MYFYNINIEFQVFSYNSKNLIRTTNDCIQFLFTERNEKQPKQN